MHKKQVNYWLGVGLIALFLIMSISPTNQILTSQKSVTQSTQDNIHAPITASGFDNNTDRYMFFFNHLVNTSILQTFSAAGGNIIDGPWLTQNGFAGNINDSSTHLGAFLANITDAEYYPDPIITAQMNTVQRQLQTYPGVINASGYGLTGDPTSSIAFLDTGIDPTQVAFNASYSQDNFSAKIVDWQDFVNASTAPADNNGHGTEIAAIAAGGGDQSLEPTHIGNGLSLTLGGNYSHYDLFYPNQVAPAPTWYSIKVGSFQLNETNTTISISASYQDYTLNGIANYQLELYENGILVNSSVENITPMNITWNTGLLTNALYELVFTYQINFGQEPIFNVLTNLSILPVNNLAPFANFTGIAPSTKIVDLKVLNNSAMGYGSDLFSALEWVYFNNSLYKITDAVLSVGNFNMADGLATHFATLIDSVIQNGTMVIIAAGNDGVGPNALNKIAQSSNAIVVGATNDDDQITDYSAQGTILPSGVNRPDVVAPGGSLLIDHDMVITSASNQVNTILNGLTEITGTSVAAALVGGSYNLVVQKLEQQNAWNFTQSSALFVKSLLLMTASETNMLREDNPLTTYNESLSSPTLDRGAPDIQEGYGRINPAAAISLLNNSISENQTVTESLTASNSNPDGTHVFAANLTLSQNVVYSFSINSTGLGNFIPDMYLYSQSPTTYGQPQLLAKSVIAGGSEQFYYCNPNATGVFYFVVKALSGTGSFNFSYTPQNNTFAPTLTNGQVIATSPNFDLLDNYTFEVTYANIQNFPPTYIFLHLNSTTQNITMINSAPTESFTTGVIFTYTLQFFQPINLMYNFTAQTGAFFNATPSYILDISSVKNMTNFPYTGNFNSNPSSTYWYYDSANALSDLNGQETELNVGWNWLSYMNYYETRDTDQTGSMYCGSTLAANPNLPLLQNDQPVYTTIGATGTYSITSPVMFLNSSLISDPYVSLGIRVSLGVGETADILVNTNRSSWITLDSFTNVQLNWFMVHYNLTAYLNTYVQIRIQVTTTGTGYYKGLFLDYFSFNQYSPTYTTLPTLSQVSGTLTYGSPLPYYSSQTGSKMQYVTFQVMYNDQNGNMPQYVYLELNGINYTMDNYYGKWNPTYTPYTNYFGIVYQVQVSLFNIQNTTYRYITFNGENYSSTPWQSAIQLTNLPEMFPFPFNGTITDDEAIVTGTPILNSPSDWVNPDNTWHRVEVTGQYANPNEWYCGIGDYAGYGTGWDTSLITEPFNLTTPNQVFLNITQELLFDAPPDLPQTDYAEIEISTNYGATWHVLEDYSNSTNGTVDSIIDLTTYINQMAMLRFQFVSYSLGAPDTVDTGWRISNIQTFINTTKDYTPPSIIYSAVDDQQINGTYVLNITITDNVQVNFNQTLIYINGVLTTVSFNNKTGTYTFKIDSTLYPNDQEIEISTIAYDTSGNKAIEKVILVIENPTDYLPLILTLTFIAIGIAIICIVVVLQRKKNQQNMAKSDYIERPSKLSMLDRVEQKSFDKNRKKEEIAKVLNHYDRAWEQKQPYTLYCKACKKWFKSVHFEIFCPVCGKEALVIAKKCPLCDSWRYFEEEGNHGCKKCKIDLLKDYNAALAEIRSRNAMVLDEPIGNAPKAPVDDSEIESEIKTQRVKSESEVKELNEQTVIQHSSPSDQTEIINLEKMNDGKDSDYKNTDDVIAHTEIAHTKILSSKEGNENSESSSEEEISPVIDQPSLEKTKKKSKKNTSKINSPENEEN